MGCVGVSSFGFCGTNAHVVLERARDVAAEHADPVVAKPAGTVAPERAEPINPACPVDTGLAATSGTLRRPVKEAFEPSENTLFLSARTPTALRALIDRYRTLLDQGVPFADICYSAASGRSRLPWWVAVHHPDELATAEPSDAPPPAIPPQAGRRVDLPFYPFERRRHWLDESDRMPGRRLVQAGATPVFEVELLPNAPLLADHRVRGERLLPAADMLERLRAAAEATGQGSSLTDIIFDRPLVVASPRTVQVEAGNPLALLARDGATWERHATASPAAMQEKPAESLAALRNACPERT